MIACSLPAVFLNERVKEVVSVSQFSVQMFNLSSIGNASSGIFPGLSSRIERPVQSTSCRYVLSSIGIPLGICLRGLPAKRISDFGCLLFCAALILDLILV